MCQDFATPSKQYKQKVLSNFIKRNQNHPSSRIVKRNIRIVLKMSNIHRFSCEASPAIASPLGPSIAAKGNHRQPLREHPESNKSCVAISESFWILEATIKNQHFRGWKTTLPMTANHDVGPLLSLAQKKVDGLRLCKISVSGQRSFNQQKWCRSTWPRNIRYIGSKTTC